MTDHERGAYAPPTDPPLSFDPRQPVRGSQPLPFTLLIGLLVLAAMGAVLYLFYQSGVREAGQAPQVVGSPIGGIKTEAPPQAKPEDPAAGLQIYRAEGDVAAAPAGPQFTQPPEQPLPRAAAPPPAQATATAAIPPAAIRPAIPTTQPAAATPKPVAAPLAQKAPPAPVKVAAAPAAKTPPPAAKTVAAPPKAAAAAPAKAAVPAPATPKAAQGGAVVQIGAVSSPELADKTWKEAMSAAGGSGKGKSVEKIDKNGGVLYRTAVTGFASRADAQAFCEKLKSAGKSCFVR